MEATTPIATEKTMRDFQLVRMAQENNDQQAFADLMRCYREPLYLMLLKMTNSPDDANDLTLESFGKAFRNLHLFKPTKSFSAWLFSIGANTCLDFLRRRRIETVSISDICCHKGDDDPIEFPIPSDSPTPEEKVMNDQRAKMLHEAVEQMKPRYRQMIELRYFEELSYGEIAARTGLPMGSVKCQLLRAKNSLEEILRNRMGMI